MSEIQSGALKLTIESRLENVALVGISVNHICRDAGLSEQGAFEVELCVVEAVTNAIRHAYLEQPGKEVEIYLELASRELKLKITDAGSPWPTDILQPRPPKTREVEEPSESGRGLFIIRSLMDQVAYTTIEGRNVLLLTRSLVEPRPAAGAKKD